MFSIQYWSRHNAYAAWEYIALGADLFLGTLSNPIQILKDYIWGNGVNE